MMTQEDIKKIQDEVWRLTKKAELTRSIHGEISDSLKDWNRVISLYVAIGSGIGTVTIFAKIPDTYFLYWGLFTASVFLVSLIPTTLNFNKSIEERILALDLLGKWIRDANNFENIEIHTMSNEEALKRQKDMLDAYKDIMGKTPPIPNKKFLESKQKHLQKIEVSRFMDKNPFLPINEIRKQLAETYKNKTQNKSISDKQGE